MCILGQKISPDSRDKVQLQVVMHDGGANTFHFSNPMGRDAQKQDRDGVKELLLQLLPKFRRKVSSELEEKNRYVILGELVSFTVFCRMTLYYTRCIRACFVFWSVSQ